MRIARYYSAEEQYDGEQSHKTDECYLMQVMANLCVIFEVLLLLHVIVIQLLICII